MQRLMWSTKYQRASKSWVETLESFSSQRLYCKVHVYNGWIGRTERQTRKTLQNIFLELLQRLMRWSLWEESSCSAEQPQGKFQRASQGKLQRPEFMGDDMCYDICSLLGQHSCQLCFGSALFTTHFFSYAWAWILKLRSSSVLSVEPLLENIHVRASDFSLHNLCILNYCCLKTTNKLDTHAPWEFFKLTTWKLRFY